MIYFFENKNVIRGFQSLGFYPKTKQKFRFWRFFFPSHCIFLTSFCKTTISLQIAVQQLKKSQNNLLKCNLRSPRSQSICQELFLTSELLVLAARIGRGLTSSSSKNAEKVSNIGVANLPPTFRTDIANKALTLVEQYRALWLSRYEPQGMQASLLVLSNLLSKFIPEGSAPDLWFVQVLYSIFN